MVTLEDIDVRGLEQMLEGLRHALNGTGGDASTVLEDEVPRLALEISGRLGPKNRSNAEKNIQRDVRQFMVAPFENLAWDQRGHGDLLWISAGPNFLTGIQAADYRVTDSTESVFKDFKENRYNLRGKAYQRLGMRGSQAVQRLNRTAVSQTTRSAVINQLQEHVGRFKASIAETAFLIRKSFTGIPAYVRRHFPNPKNITDLSQMRSMDFPSITFGSNARGISKASEIFRKAARTRQYKIAQRLKLVLSGYSTDVAHGIRPRRNARKNHGLD